MLENQEWRESLECGSESEVLSAIRYLDPDLEPERIQRDASEICGVVIALLTAVVGAVTSISLHFGRL
jgi:hypothetical protein